MHRSYILTHYRPIVMKIRLLYLVSFLMTFRSLPSQAQTWKPDWQQLQNRPTPQWFQDAKLGIFIHWGLYSVPSWSGREQYAEWFLKGLLSGDSARIQFQKRVYGNNWQYADYAKLFKAELFDAGEWASIFKESGAKYVIMVSKHHDGYCLYPSQYARGWNSMETGPHRDLVGELDKAVRDKGMKMGLYYSLPEWNNRLYRWTFDPPDKVKNYVEKHMKPQFAELIERYKPDLVFADGDWDFPASAWHSAEMISDYYNLIGDSAVVNDRWGQGSEGCGFRTPEYSSGAKPGVRPWTEVRGLGRSFGLNRNEPLEAYSTAADLVYCLVNAVAHGGGLTINVGPGADGQIPLIQQEKLKQLGQWLKVNGDAIYGSRMYVKHDFTKLVEIQRYEPNIDFDWVRNSPGKPVSEDHFHGYWTGTIQAPASGTYQFESDADDDFRLYVDGELVLNNWDYSDSSYKFNAEDIRVSEHPDGKFFMEAGKHYKIFAEYYESDANAHVKLLWSSDKQPREVVPEKSLYRQPGDTVHHGLSAIYSSMNPWLFYTRNHGNIYAIFTDWPADNKLRLDIERPFKTLNIRMLGTFETLPWTYENGQVVVDLKGFSPANLPCTWAWTLQVEWFPVE